MNQRDIITTKRFVVLAVGCGMALGTLVTIGSQRLIPKCHRTPEQVSRSAALPSRFQEILVLRPDRVGPFDIAVLNLLCVEGLAGDEPVDVSKSLASLDTYTKRVQSETQRHFYKFQKNPAEFNHLEGYFRMLALVTVLQQDFGVRYNPERAQQPDYTKADDLFLTGVLGKQRQGTCVSLPVLYVAVGRRLGYPLKLVTTKAHVFARWESVDGKERFNIEGTNEGLNCFPDDYYRTWPVPMTAAEAQRGQYLRSLTAAEELALFLSVRGHCLETLGRLAEAQLAHAHAHALAPQSPVYLAFLAGAVKKELPGWEAVQIDLGRNTRKEHFSAKN